MLPFFLVAVDLSLAQLSTGATAAVVRNMAEQIGWGLVVGIGAGTLVGLLLRAADDRGWLEGQWRQILPHLAALLAYLAAPRLGGSGFIAAFTGGMTFGYLSRHHGPGVTSLNEDVGEHSRTPPGLVSGRSPSAYCCRTSPGRSSPLRRSA